MRDPARPHDAGHERHQFYAEQQHDPALASIPIVVISADGNLAHKAAAFGGEFLSKPVRLETVLGVIGRLCN